MGFLGGTRERELKQSKELKCSFLFPPLYLGGTRSSTEICLFPLKQSCRVSHVYALHRRGEKAILVSFAKRENNIDQKEIYAQVS